MNKISLKQSLLESLASFLFNLYEEAWNDGYKAGKCNKKSKSKKYKKGGDK